MNHKKGKKHYADKFKSFKVSEVNERNQMLLQTPIARTRWFQTLNQCLIKILQKFKCCSFGNKQNVKGSTTEKLFIGKKQEPSVLKPDLIQFLVKQEKQ